MLSLPVAFTLACLILLAALVFAEWRAWAWLQRCSKPAASMAFVAVALALDAPASGYGQAVLLALVLGAVGDVCLLSLRHTWFLGGLAAFLLSHIAYAAAFCIGPHDDTALAIAVLPMSVFGAVVLRWLWPYLASGFRAAVALYVLAIVAMCTLAMSHAVATAAWPVAIGAVAFAVSDVSVARDRFVAPGFVNRAWGLPLYYAAQLLLAWSVA